MAALPSNGRAPCRATTAAVAAALCTALLAGCGDSPKASGPTDTESTAPTPTVTTIPLPADRPQRPACGLITQAEVEAALGIKVNPGKENTNEGRSLCAFSIGAAADQSVAVVSTASSGVPATFDAGRARAQSPQAVTAGEQAYVVGNQAVVRKGDTMVAILVAVRQAPAQLVAVATKLVQAVGNRL